jgi:glycosyltransferase involved in cell wall biosynthesis
MESTLPLAKHLSLSGIDVDLFSLLPYKNQNAFVYDFSSNPQPVGFVDKKNIAKTFGKKLLDYLSGININVFIFPDRKLQKLFFKDLYYAYKLSQKIKKGNYDLVHIIHTSPRFWFLLYFFLDKKKVVQTLHEVISHEGETSLSSKWILKLLIKNSTPIIFHSDISRQRFVDFRNTVSNKEVKSDHLAMIRFGLFETYYCFSNGGDNKKISDTINIVNFGRIVPSKGIHFLLDAVKILQKKYPIHVTIAGRGEPYFDFKGINSYDFINRFISNEEIVSLIEESDMVVMPYTSASQSGIPMTAYAFNKPIVATNIAGLKEVIDDSKTGIIVNNLNAENLAAAMETLIINPDLKEKMSTNIKEKYSVGEFSWPFIAAETISFYKKHLNWQDAKEEKFQQ